MKFIVTARSARINTGVLLLTKEQAEARSHNLNHLGKNRYEIINTVEFKNGEEIGYEGDLPKTLAENMTAKAESVAAEKKASEAEAKARSKAEAEVAEQRKRIEADAFTEWNKSEQLRAEHADDFDAYLAAVMEQVS
jgi:hypothetical protein